MRFEDVLPSLKAAAKRWVPELKIDQENEPAIRYIMAWACAHRTFQGDPGKGLLLLGHKGTGKTLTMRALNLCIDLPLKFAVHNTRKVTSAYNTDGDEGLRPYLAHQHMMFDDLGDERLGQHYGDKVEVMSIVIQERYELFVDHGIMTHFTTNLTTTEIAARYGDRVYSRLKHMINSVVYGPEESATDRRDGAPAPVRKEPEERPLEPATTLEQALEYSASLKGAIAGIASKFSVLKPVHVKPEPTSHEKELEAFVKGIAGRSEVELEQARELIGSRNTELAAVPYLEAIDRELARARDRSGTNEVSGPEGTEPAHNPVPVGDAPKTFLEQLEKVKDQIEESGNDVVQLAVEIQGGEGVPPAGSRSSGVPSSASLQTTAAPFPYDR